AAASSSRRHFATAVVSFAITASRRRTRVELSPSADSLAHASRPSTLQRLAQCWSLAVMWGYSPSAPAKPPRGPRAGGAVAEREVARGREREQRHLAVDHREVDGASLPGHGASVQRGEDRDRQPQPRGEVGDRQAGLHGRTAALASEAHDPAHRLEHGVVALAVRIRSGLAEAGAGDIDEP